MTIKDYPIQITLVPVIRLNFIQFPIFNSRQHSLASTEFSVCNILQHNRHCCCGQLASLVGRVSHWVMLKLRTTSLRTPSVSDTAVNPQQCLCGWHDPLPFSQFTGKQLVSKIDAIEAQPCVKTLLVICPDACPPNENVVLTTIAPS